VKEIERTRKNIEDIGVFQRHGYSAGKLKKKENYSRMGLDFSILILFYMY
jgi:hypothetical protein